MRQTTDNTLLEAGGLTAFFEGDAARVCVLDDVSLALGRGEFVDVAGPSGAGKSTLLRALARLLPDVSGDLLLDGRPAAEFTPQEWRSKVAMLPQKPAMCDGDIRANLLLPWTMRVRHGQTSPDAETLGSELESLGLGEVALSRDVARLSVGQQARVALLRVMLTAPRVLLLDEPDAALDLTSAEEVASKLLAFVAGGGAILRVRHREDDGLATRRLIMRAGVLEGETGT